MRETLEWRAPAEIDDVFRIDRRFVGSKPAQRQAELRLLVAKPYIRVERADVVGQVAHGDDRVDRTIEEADRKADNITRQDHIQDLSLAAAQQLVADRIAILDETETAIRGAGDDEIVPPFDQALTLDNAFEVPEIGRAEGHQTRQPRHERMFGERWIVSDLRSSTHAASRIPNVAPSAHYVCLLIQINDQDHRTKVALTASPLRLAIDLTRPLRVTRGNQRRETTQNGSGKRLHPRGRN